MVTVSWPSAAANTARQLWPVRRLQRLPGGGAHALDERGAGGGIELGIFDGVRRHQRRRR